jgi:putative ABC transport system substrate-binding protein
MMYRRSFLTLLGTSAAVWPLAARAQQTDHIRRVGFLGANSPAVQLQWTNAFVERLRELGWVEGRNIAVDYRWAEGRNERYIAIASEFAGLRLDVIVTHGTLATMAAKQATSVIPIVSAVMGDPISTGLITSLARPGNITGLSVVSPDVAGKRLELLREVAPSVRRLAILFNIGNPVSVQEAREVEAAARQLNLEATTFEIRRAEDIGPAFDALKGRAEALYVVADPVVLSNVIRINILSVAARLPTIYIGREYVQAGALMSYGPNYPQLYCRFRRQDTPWPQTRRYSSRAADQIRTRRQPDHRQGARPHDPGNVPGARRRSD